MNNVKSGIYPAMITPYLADGEIDYAGVGELVDWYAANQADGIFAVCQSSEIFYLTLKERVALAEKVIECAPPEMDIVVSGHIADGIDDQITELKAMADTGAKAVVLITNRLAGADESDDILLRNTDKILNALPDTAFGLYECPYPYKRLIPAKTLRTLAETGRFLFFKETSCDLKSISEKVDAVKGTPLKLYNANSAMFLASLKLGADGICGIMCNFHPDLYQEVMTCYQKNPVRAEWLQRYLGVTSIFEYQNYPTNAKQYLQLEGLNINTYSRKNPSNGLAPAQQLVLRQFFEENQEIRNKLRNE